MKDIIRDGDPTPTLRGDKQSQSIKRMTTRCSICEHLTWYHSFPLIEPEDVQLRLSPVRTPLRLRIAMGLVASERSPYAYAPTRKPLTDRSWIIIMAWGFGIAMLLHLLLIVMLATVAGH